ncbi:MAG: hypothetical protein NVS3B7_09490 [Candidatus Elarobacter sp.]
MKQPQRSPRLIAALVLALSFAAPIPAFAAEKMVKLTMDGRPVDRAGGIAVSRGGVVYADLVDLVKSFNGLLTFQGDAVVVTINSRTATFTVGSRTMKLDLGAVVMRGQTFKRNGDVFVPLDAFVTRLAGAKLKVDGAQTRADIAVTAVP